MAWLPRRSSSDGPWIPRCRGWLVQQPASRGFLSAFDLNGVALPVQPQSPTDRDALAEDWNAIGADFRRALNSAPELREP